MARGFDSKSVSEQQDEAERRRERAESNAPPPLPSPRRRTLELAREDVRRRLLHAPEGMRPGLQAALDALEAQLRDLA